MGEGIFLLFLTPAAPDYRILRGEPRKHHSAMLQLGRLPSPARGRTGGRQRGVGACTRGCERASVHVRVCVCTHSQQAWFLPSLSHGATAERLPAAFKRVCFSTPAPNSIRTNCIWERGWAFWWGVFGLLLNKLGWQFAYHYPACLSSSQPGQDPKSGHGQQSSSPEFP